MTADGGSLNEGDLPITSGCVFDVLGVLSSTIPETGAGSRTVDAVGCEDSTGSANLLEMGLDNKSSMIAGISPDGNFGDDLPVAVNGVSGAGDREVERVGWFSSSRRVPGRSVTSVTTGVGGSTFNKRLLCFVRPGDL